MNRRTFLSLSAITPLASWLPAFEQQLDQAAKIHELKADVLICGAGVGGIAAALAAAIAGKSVILTEPNDWIGGQLTSQGVPPDEYPTIESYPCTRLYGEFRSRVRDFYRRNYPLSEAAAKAATLNPGNGTVSRLCHEPRIAVAVLLEMLSPYLSGGRIRLLQPYQPVAADIDGDRVRAVTLARRDDNLVITVTAAYIVDATELGDLLPLAKVEYVTGAESQRQTGEPSAPEQAQPDNHQSFTVCFAMDYLDGEDYTIQRPTEYAFWRDYVPKLTPPWPGRLLSLMMSHPVTLKPRQMGFDPTGPTPKDVPNLWTYRRIADRSNFASGIYPGDICLVNWPQNDYWLGGLLGDEQETNKHIQRGIELSLSLLYWLQTEAPRPDGGTGWKGLRLRPDVLGTEHGCAQYPYVREARRIQAEFTVTENHVGTNARAQLTGKKPGEFTAEIFPDSVGIGSYRIDLHPSTGGDNYIDVSSLPFQVPLGSLIPKRVENLLPACKNIGTTHITNGCYRLHPVEWTIGEAVGNLIAFCLRRNTVPRQVRKDQRLLTELQSMLSQSGVKLEWPPDVATQPR
jgi:hypothetical protein